MQHLAAMFAAMFAAAWCRTDLCLGRLKFISVERCCRLGPSSAREQHGEQHGGGVCGDEPRARFRRGKAEAKGKQCGESRNSSEASSPRLSAVYM